MEQAKQAGEGEGAEAANDVSEAEQRLRDVVMIYGGLAFCDSCHGEANPDAPVFADAEWAAQAAAMHRDGWRSPDGLTVFCTQCLERELNA